MFLYALKKFLIVFSILLLCGGIFVGIIDFQNGATGYTGPISDHFDGKRFYNIPDSAIPQEQIVTLYGIYEWLFAGRTKWTKNLVQPIIPSETTTGVTITYVGHATVLIQIGPYNILTDPIWSAYPSPVPGIGHGRYADPGIEIGNLPQIDIILISHNHYDHLDLPTLKFLSKRDNPDILTGLGNSEYLKKNSISKSQDLDWFEGKSYSSGISITFVPSNHYSARAISDRYDTLWGGFVIEGNGKRIYFAGDTGYTGGFKSEIKAKYSTGFDIGLLPIGAYRPSIIMRPYHLNPEEALEVQNELSIDTVIGIHWGTFSLGKDNQIEPIIDFEFAKKQFPTQDFRIGSSGTQWNFE